MAKAKGIKIAVAIWKLPIEALKPEGPPNVVFHTFGPFGRKETRASKRRRVRWAIREELRNEILQTITDFPGDDEVEALRGKATE